MDDLISRQAAIDALCMAGCDSGHCGVSCDDVMAIETLPSAQPEIIRCKDCKHRIVNVNIGKHSYIKLKAVCELDTGNVFELGRKAWDDEWFCADAERRE